MRLSHLAQLDELEDRLKDEAWWPGVLIRVVDGETLNEIARGYGCNGSVLREWIRREDDREQAYQEALERKREMAGEELLDRTRRAAFATVQDAQTAGGEWLDVMAWPKEVAAAADDVEFGPDGRPYKIKMNSGKAGDRLARMLGMDKTGQTNVSLSMSLVGILSEMPAAAKRQVQVRGEVSDAEVIGGGSSNAPKQVSKNSGEAHGLNADYAAVHGLASVHVAAGSVADAPEPADTVTPAARSSLAVTAPGRSVVGPI